MQKTEQQSQMFLSMKHARQVYTVLHTAWWESYKVKEQHPEIETTMIHAIERVTEEAIKRYAKPTVPDCQECKRNSVFGGPGHHASPYCRSGQRPHCTCDICY